MTRYEILKNQQDNILQLISKNFIPVHLLDWKVYYEAYLQEMEYNIRNYKKPKKTKAVEQVAENYRLSRKTMFNIIKFMETD